MNLFNYRAVSVSCGMLRTISFHLVPLLGGDSCLLLSKMIAFRELRVMRPLLNEFLLLGEYGCYCIEVVG